MNKKQKWRVYAIQILHFILKTGGTPNKKATKDENPKKGNDSLKEKAEEEREER